MNYPPDTRDKIAQIIKQHPYWPPRLVRKQFLEQYGVSVSNWMLWDARASHGLPTWHQMVEKRRVLVKDIITRKGKYLNTSDLLQILKNSHDCPMSRGTLQRTMREVDASVTPATTHPEHYEILEAAKKAVSALGKPKGGRGNSMRPYYDIMIPELDQQVELSTLRSFVWKACEASN